MAKKTICVDFDGVIHSYDSGWKGHDVVSDGPVPGAIDWLKRAVLFFDIQIYSSRSKEHEGIQAMRNWLLENGLSMELLNEIKFPTQKPAAFLTIDDRAICFEGTFPTFEEINSFRPWNKR